MKYFIHYSYTINDKEIGIYNLNIIKYSLPNNFQIQTQIFSYSPSYSYPLSLVFYLNNGYKLFLNTNYIINDLNLIGYDNTNSSYWSTPIQVLFNPEYNIIDPNISIWCSKATSTESGNTYQIYAYVTFDSYSN